VAEQALAQDMRSNRRLFSLSAQLAQDRAARWWSRPEGWVGQFTVTRFF
jgi:hypothetical protein